MFLAKQFHSLSNVLLCTINFMMTIYSLFYLSYVTCSVFEQYASVTSSVPLPSFVDLDDYKSMMKRVMMRKDVLVDDQGQDVVEALRLELGYVTRAEAIKHFFDRNEPETNAIISRILGAGNDLVLAAAIAKPISRSVLQPLTDAVVEYITRRRQMCLYDYMPIGLRSFDKYSEYFTPLDKDEYSITSLSKVGHVTLLDPKIATDSTVNLIERHLLYVSGGDSQLIIDFNRGCLVRVNDNIGMNGAPSSRVVVAKDKLSNTLFIWRSDSVLPTGIPFEEGYRLGDIAMNTDQSPYDVYLVMHRLNEHKFYKFSTSIDQPMRLIPFEPTTDQDRNWRLFRLGTRTIPHEGKVLVLSNILIAVLESVCDIIPFFHIAKGSPLEALDDMVRRKDFFAIWAECDRIQLIQRVKKLISSMTPDCSDYNKRFNLGIAHVVAEILELPAVPDDVRRFILGA